MSLASRTSLRRFSAVLLAALGTVSCVAAPVPRGEGISLIVQVDIDQARAEYLERFRPLFSGGLRRLLEEGAVFTDAHHEHAVTETAPGHATIATGTVPARSGIIANAWYQRDEGEVVLSVGDSDEPSPEYLERTTLGDWIKAHDGRGRVFSASGKDRSAVMLGGHDADGAYWYDRETGAWRTGSYYRDARRPWLEDLNLRRPLESLFGTLWTPIRPEQDLERYAIRRLDAGVFERGFPHAVGGYELEPGDGFYGAVYDSPYVDWYLHRLAETILVEEDLGQDGSVDLLALSFSALDTVGHEYGPNSPEVLDVLLRLDRLLGELMDVLEAQVGREHLVVALSADHGVPPLPEYRRLAGEPGQRLGDAGIACIQNAGVALRQRIGGRDWLLSSEGGFYLNEVALDGLGVDKAAVERMAAEVIDQCDSVRRVWTSTELSSGEFGDDIYARRFRNSYHPERSPDLLLQLEPYSLLWATGTSHGSPYEYDSHVPMILWGGGISPGVVERRVATVDLAPTLASLAGVPAPDDLDGVDRTRLLPRPTATDR